jgi:hypothetical protein
LTGTGDVNRPAGEVAVVTPADRRDWGPADWAGLRGVRVRVDTPGDPVDRAHGLQVLSDVGTVAEVEAGPGRGSGRLRLTGGFTVPVEVDSTLRVCRRPGCVHDEDPGCRVTTRQGA